MNKCKRCGAELTEEAKFCSECGARIETEKPAPAPEKAAEGAKKPFYHRWWFWIALAIALLLIVPSNNEETPDEPSKEVIEGDKEREESWRDNYAPELVEEIESAFEEIGENPDNIINVEYVDIHTSGYVFEQKCYKVEFSWSLGKPGYKHSRYYRIVTQKYYDGEPEKEQYPNEFLCTIKYWVGDDGHGTNVNQWSWTGNGEKQ